MEEKEQKVSEVSLRTAVISVIVVIVVVVSVGLYLGNTYFWKPVEEKNILEKKFAVAEQVYQKYPQSKDAALAYAIALYTQGEEEAASKRFKELETRFPKDTAVLINYAVFKKEAGDIKEAKRLLEKVLKQSPYFVMANVNYGMILREEGKNDEALAAFDKALKIEPGAADILVEKAKVYVAMKDTQKAKENLQRAISLVPDYEDAVKILNELK